MKCYIQGSLLLLILLAAQVLSAQCYELVWADEFNSGTQPNPAYWSYDLGTGQAGWGNNEIQVYTQSSDNVRIENGGLLIQARREGGSQWSSARIKTQAKQSFTYGRVEFRAKLPTGSGTWPALWMLGEDIVTESWPACGEIDVMEHVGKDPGTIHASLHTPSSFGATVNTRSRQLPTFNSSFHVYATEWDEEAIRFYIDDQLYYTYAPAGKNASNWPFDDPFFLIMNVAMGGDFGSDPQYETGGQRNGIDPNLELATMEVDYVRVYQENIEPNILGDTLVEPKASGLTYHVDLAIEGTYDWTVPDDAEIVSGQGSSRITVNWGERAGPIEVSIQGQCDIYTLTLPVTTKLIPDGDRFLLDGFTDAQPSNWTTEAGSGNTLILTETSDELRIDYDIIDPGQNPRLRFELDQPVDLGGLSEMQVQVRTRNLSGTVALRIDPFDARGVIKDASPVFRLEPIQDDGTYTTYSFDFAGNWSGSGGQSLDTTQFQGFYLYVNYGFFGRPGQDSLWLKQVEMVKPGVVSTVLDQELQQDYRVFPNPARESVTLSRSIAQAGAETILRVYDVQGRLVRRGLFPQGKTRQELDLTRLQAGMYWLTLEQKGRMARKALIIQD